MLMKENASFSNYGVGGKDAYSTVQLAGIGS